ncbi:MAG TPA: four helix bundle protein [Fimbriiglobus sp.]|jgi:four helix bundle protein
MVANDREQLRPRTKAFALRVIKLVDALPTRSRAANVIGNQLLRSATSVGANYRASCRARSTAEFCSKMGIVEEEADESVYWIELLVESGIMPAERLQALMDEGNEIVSMVVASIRTAKHKGNSRSLTPNSELRTPNSVSP